MTGARARLRPADRRRTAAGALRVHWRFVARLTDVPPCWFWDHDILRATGCIEIAPGVWIDDDPWPSAEIAEQKALENCAKVNAKTGGVAMTFLRAAAFEEPA